MRSGKSVRKRERDKERAIKVERMKEGEKEGGMGRYDSQRTTEFPFFLFGVFHDPLTPRSTQLFQG